MSIHVVCERSVDLAQGTDGFHLLICSQSNAKKITHMKPTLGQSEILTHPQDLPYRFRPWLVGESVDWFPDRSDFRLAIRTVGARLGRQLLRVPPP